MSPLNQIEEASGDTAEMSFVEHLEALRWHLMRSALAIVVFSVVAFFMKDFLFGTLIFGPLKSDFFTYRAFCWLSAHIFHNDSMCIHINPDKVKIINTEMSGQFMMHIQSAIAAGFVVAFPYVAWEAWRFVKPGLTRNEVRYTQGLVFFMSMLFFAGVLFGYYIMAPSALQFFVNYEITPGMVSNFFTLDNYVSFITTFVLTAGLVFELPVAVYFLSKLGILSPGFMRQYRRYAVVVLLVVAAVITPTPDMGTQMIVFTPLYILYELSIFVSARVEKDRKRQGLD